MTPAPVTSLADAVDATVADAIARAVPESDGAQALVRRSDFADYQANAALSLAKQVGRPPRDLGTAIAEAVGGELIAEATVSGPGFVNLTVADSVIWRQVAARLADERLGTATMLDGRTLVVDYSGPNIAKEMHVGHLRTTIIGDALVRIAEHLGATVVRHNHVGDWGTQFGMLIEYLSDHPEAEWHRVDEADPTANITALDRLYKQARTAFDADPDFADRARARVVALQSGDEATVSIWRDLVTVSTTAFGTIYDRLGVTLGDTDYDGESGYNDQLANVVDELVSAGIAVESEGALCVFFDDVQGPDGTPVPLMLRKSDGGYGYAATDLATIRHRVRDLSADEILYVVDARQALHFQQVFATARRAGWLPDSVTADHVAFGTVLGADGRPFKTRSGGTVRLADLLDEAEAKAAAVITEKNPDIEPRDLAGLATATGMGAVKYAELSTSRLKDYRFDTDQMVALTGNTGVYLQYAHTRMSAILRKAAADPQTVITDPTTLSPPERSLALHLDAYNAVLVETMAEREPHRLAAYLYALAKAFTSFYEASPVLRAETETLRNNRLALVQLSKQTLAHGLGLLGVSAPDHM